MVISVEQAAVMLKIPVSTLQALIDGKIAMDADIAQKLATCFSTTLDLWLNIQHNFDK